MAAQRTDVAEIEGAKNGPQTFLDALKSFAVSRSLMTAIELDLFALVGAHDYEIDELGQRLNLKPQMARPFLWTLIAAGYLEVKSGKARLGPNAAWLCDADPGFKSWNKEMVLAYSSLSRLTEFLQDGLQGSNPLREYWAYKKESENRDAGGETTGDYSETMDDSQDEIARAIADAYDFSQHRHMVDMGGGYGRFAMTIAERFGELRATVVDLPSVAAEGARRVGRRGLQARIDCRGADFLRDPIDVSPDLVCFIRVLLDWDDVSVKTLLSRAFDLLPSDGALLINDLVLKDDPAEIDVATSAWMMNVALVGGKLRTFREYRELLSGAGFERVSFQPILRTPTLIVARKPR